MTRIIHAHALAVACLSTLALAACQTTSPPAPKTVEIHMTQDGGILWNGKRMGTEELKSLAMNQVRKAPGARVDVRADSTVLYGDVVEVLTILQRSGLTNAGVAASN